MKKWTIKASEKATWTEEEKGLVACLEADGLTVSKWNKMSAAAQAEYLENLAKVAVETGIVENPETPAEAEEVKVEETSETPAEEPEDKTPEPEKKKPTPVEEVGEMIKSKGFTYTVTKDKPHLIVKEAGYILRLQPSKNGTKVRCNKKFAEACDLHTEFHQNWSTPYSVGKDDIVDPTDVMEILVTLTTPAEEPKPADPVNETPAEDTPADDVK